MQTTTTTNTYQIVALDGVTAFIAPVNALGAAVELDYSALPAGARFGDRLQLDSGFVLLPVARDAAADESTLRRLASALVAAAAVTLGMGADQARAALLAVI